MQSPKADQSTIRSSLERAINLVIIEIRDERECEGSDVQWQANLRVRMCNCFECVGGTGEGGGDGEAVVQAVLCLNGEK